MAEHECDIRGGNTKNAFAKHLAMHHPDEERNPELFKFECVKTVSRCLDRQVAEAVHIFRSKVDTALNSKSEFMQPTVERVVIAKQLDN